MPHFFFFWKKVYHEAGLITKQDILLDPKIALSPYYSETAQQISHKDLITHLTTALQHIENKLEVAPNSTAVLEPVMDSKKPPASTTRKISRKDLALHCCQLISGPNSKASRSSSQKERSLRCPLRTTTLDSNVGKNGHVEFHEPLVASFRSILPLRSPFPLSPVPLCLKRKEAGNKTEKMKHFTFEKSESDLHSRDFQSPSFADETVVRYLNDRPAIDALQNSEVFFKSVSEEEKAEKSRDEYSKTSQSTTTQDADLKELQLAEPSSSTNTSSAHRLDILKQHRREAKLEKLKERIRKQLGRPEELSSRGNHLQYDDHPIPAAAVTPKVRKVAAAPPAPSYKGFNPSEAKIRTPDGKVWREEEYINLSRELGPDLELQLADNLTVKETPAGKAKGKKATRPVRKIQKVARLSSPDSKPGSTSVICTSSWREGLRLAKKILGPAPKVGQQDQEPLSIDRAGKDKPTKSGKLSFLDVTIETRSRNSERSQSKVRVENNTKKKELTFPDSKRKEDHVNKDFLPVEIRGMLDDLQLDSVSQGAEQMRDEGRQDQKSPPFALIRSHSPTKRKPDKLSANEEPQVTSKKRYYDTDEVRQYIARQKEERKKRQNEEKKAQKVATEQKNKRLQELYKKQKEAFANKTKETLAPELATKQLQETYSKLFLEQTLLEEPLVPGQEAKPGYQPSGESDKENKAQERPPSASSSSDMSLSEAAAPPPPLIRNNPLWIQPDRLTSEAQLSSQQPSMVLTGGFVSQLLALDHTHVLQNDFDSALPSRRSYSAAVGSMPLASQPFMASAVQPTINQYKSKLNRIEALKATAASLSSRIESEAKKLAGASINYGEVWNSERDLLQGDQGDGRWAKASSPPVEESDVFSARLQKMLGACTPHASFDDNLPGVGNLGEFKRLPETLGPRAAAISLPGNYRAEGMLGDLSKKQACSPGAESKVVAPRDGSVESISEGPISDGLASEEEGERRDHPTWKTVEVLKEKEFCAAEIAGCEPVKDVQKEAEKCLLIFRHIRSTWEELIRGSPHSAINVFTKHYQQRGKGKAMRDLLLPLSPAVFYFRVYIDSGSSPSLKEEFATRKSLYEQPAVEFTHHSSGTLSAGSSNSSASSKKRVKKESKCHLLRSQSWVETFGKVLKSENVKCTCQVGEIFHIYLTGTMRFSPAGLQHRMSAELNYLSAIEESVRQISDVERVRGISLAQQESVSLAQILKAQQQRHEHDLALLKLKAEQEALESQRQLEEAMKKAAQGHAESMQQLVQSQQEKADALQETTCKIAAQQAETALLTTEAASQIREVRFCSEILGRLGLVSSSSCPGSPSVSPSKGTKKLSRREKSGSSIEEQAPMAMNDSLMNNSIPSIADERDSASVATEYSLKFDESMTEDEIEEKSFRSLLPSESHRRINLKKRVHQDYSDEEAFPGKTSVSPVKELSLPFSGGQDSFSKFTMEMVRQYMKEEEVRSAHQSSLLRLREKALKEKARAELAWLDHQKKRLRDKGEDDKMPPIRKKQRGLLLKLQQEKAEIKRLKEANKAARKERQLILKQQEEIERIRQTTMKLQEKLKSAGENKQEHFSEDDVKRTRSSTPLPSDAETWSLSSVSGSETSSIMQKLKKMRSHMDEKFLTKREQKLMKRRQHAEELLEWKRRLDAEEEEIRQIEKQALAAWDMELLKAKVNRKGAGDQKSDAKETASDQSDVEGRIQALKDKLRKRKSVVYQLKKERKKRYKERLRAQEASLIKQLETYDEFIKKTEAELSRDLEATSTAKPQIKTPSSPTEKPKIKSSSLTRSEPTKSWKSITDSERPRGSLESIAEHVDAASHEKSVSAYTKKFIEAEIQTEEHSRTLNSFVQSPRISRAEPGGSLDSLASSALFKDLGDLSKTSHVSQDRFEDAESYDSIVSTIRSVIQEEIESVESEAEVSQKVSERCDAYKFNKELKSSPPASLKTDVCPEAELLEKNQTELAFVCVERKTEMPKETNKDDKSALSIKSSPALSKELLKGDALVSEKISICKEPAYSNDFEVSSSGTEMSKDETSLTEYYKDDFDTFTLSLEKDSRSQGEKSCYTKTPRSSIESDDEVSECLSDKSSSVAGSVHSERLLELKSPTEFMKSRERSDVEEEPSHVDSSLWVSVSKTEEENILRGFSIGDRVLVSNIQPGTLRFKGLTEFAKGFWAGVELDKPEGNNNGTYNGVQYFNCKEKHGIFAPPQKISHILESSNNFMDTAENSLCKQELNHHKVDQNEKENLEEESEGRNLSKKCPQNNSPRDASAIEDSPAAEDCITFASPLLDLLTKERSQLEAQLRVPSQKEEERIEQKKKVGLLADSLLQAFVKDTVHELRQIGKVKNEKIQSSNQDLCSVQEKRLEANDLQSTLISELDDGEEVYSPDMYPRAESPVCCPGGQEELAKRLAELELSREFLDLSDDEQDWFEEDFGLSSQKLVQKEAEDLAVPSETELPKVPSKPCEELLAVPHTAEEVEELVHAAAEELWKCKKLGHEIQAFRLPRELSDSPRDDDIEAVSEQIYKQAVFDLTREIFEEIFAEDPSINQPIWMKSCRIITGYFHRVKDPNDLEEIKCFITTEVLRLLSLKKEPNHKTDWQKMMKFGRKKRDRVDHILTQELHEEEAQWVNYDEDELQVKMQLADGIFDALLKDTVDVLHQINEKHKKLLPV
uniref:Centrosomal protein 350 n=1 Tax=Podarcis muralis TaxID=64176 RepID=A0A670I165_PODMU